MDNNIEAEIKGHQQELVEPAATLFAVQRVFGNKVREQTKQAYGRLVDAHLLISGVLGAALLRVNGKITAITPTSEERNALFASFVIGLEASESAIAEGRYLQARALLRQEMETVARLTEIRLGKHRDGRTPNVGVLEESIARLYGGLSDSAHLARHHVVRAATEWNMEGMDLPGSTSGARYYPEFEEGHARRSFGLHLMLILYVIEELSMDLNEQHNADGFTEREAQAAKLALILMRLEGVVEVG